MNSAIATDGNLSYGRIGGLLSHARSAGDHERIADLQRQLAVLRARDAIVKLLDGVDLTDADRALLVAAIG